jgi:hypothetical protein
MEDERAIPLVGADNPDVVAGRPADAEERGRRTGEDDLGGRRGRLRDLDRDRRRRVGAARRRRSEKNEETGA